MRLYRYGVTGEEWKGTLAEQEHKCAACGNTFGTTKRSGPHQDHDHECCPKVPTCGECNRGVLCGRCNVVLGMLEDEPRLLPQYLLEYLRTFGKQFPS